MCLEWNHKRILHKNIEWVNCDQHKITSETMVYRNFVSDSGDLFCWASSQFSAMVSAMYFESECARGVFFKKILYFFVWDFF